MLFYSYFKTLVGKEVSNVVVSRAWSMAAKPCQQPMHQPMPQLAQQVPRLLLICVGIFGFNLLPACCHVQHHSWDQRNSRINNLKQPAGSTISLHAGTPRCHARPHFSTQVHPHYACAAAARPLSRSRWS